MGGAERALEHILGDGTDQISREEIPGVETPEIGAGIVVVVGGEPTAQFLRLLLGLRNLIALHLGLLDLLAQVVNVGFAVLESLHQQIILRVAGGLGGAL